MSVFRGNILEYPGLIIDHFSPSNCRRGRAFFLSHCHKDHMSGLDSKDLLIALKELNLSFYCSEVTQALLENDSDFAHIRKFLKSLPIEEPTSLTLTPYRDEDKLMIVTVTLLPAGHCPGSVMFLIQGSSGNILYTGDFRLTVDEVKKFDALHVAGSSRPLQLKTIYLDTTFCHPKSSNIITRDETRDVIIKKVKEWLSQNTSNVVHLNCCSYGYEHIFVSLANEFHCKIHVSSWKLKTYSILPSVHECLTDNGTNTRIHACYYRKGQKKFGLPCRPSKVRDDQCVLYIKPSVQWFVTNGINESSVFVPAANLYRVMHSMHASYSEIINFISYLSPETIIPCVIPYTLGDTSHLDLHTRLRFLLPTTTTSASINIVTSCNADNVTITSKESEGHTCIEPDDDDDDNDDDDTDYVTDDELAKSSDHLSQQSSNASFTFNLPALQSTNVNHKIPAGPIVQPVIDLTFKEYTAEEIISSPKTKKLKLSLAKDENIPIESITDEFVISNRSYLLTPSSNDSTTSNDTPVSPVSSGCVEVIDLTNEDDDNLSHGSPLILIDAVSPVKQVYITSSSSSRHSNDSSNDSSCIQVLPPTPGKDKVDSVLSKRKFNFI